MILGFGIQGFLLSMLSVLHDCIPECPSHSTLSMKDVQKRILKVAPSFSRNLHRNFEIVNTEQVLSTVIVQHHVDP